jgi:hypothetical protein
MHENRNEVYFLNKVRNMSTRLTVRAVVILAVMDLPFLGCTSLTLQESTVREGSTETEAAPLLFQKIVEITKI